MGTDLKGIQEVVKDFTEAYESRDVQRIVEFFADDAEWLLTGLGKFNGKDNIRQLVEWDARITPTVRHRSLGIGVLVEGNVAVREGVVEATYEGIEYEIPMATIFEFDDDRKIRRMRSYYDKLGEMQQVVNGFTGVKGWLPKRLVNFLVAQGSKGAPRSA